MIPEIKDKNPINLIYIEALLLWFYNNNKEDSTKSSLLIKDKDFQGKFKTPIISKLYVGTNNLADYFKKIDREQYGHMRLDFMLKRINLTEPVITQ